MTAQVDPLAPLMLMRRIATGLLLLMALLFVVATHFEHSATWVGFLRAFAEAALVGALADWFAVTALFRHPLGLPIPHTAIIQKNKDRIGASVARFLEHNFMTREVVTNEFAQIDFAGVAVAWLQRPEHSRAVARQLTDAVPSMLRLIEDDEVSRFLHGRVERLLAQVRFAPLCADVLAILVADGWHQALFDHLLELVAKALDDNQAYIRQKIHDNSPRWIPRALDEKFFFRLLDGLDDVIAEMKQADSTWRARFQEAADALVQRLRESPEYEQKIAALVATAVHHPVFVGYVDALWQETRARLLRDVLSDQSRLALRTEQALLALCTALAGAPAVQQRLNDWLRDFAADAIVRRRGAIAALVERVINQWDGETVAQKFELYIGKDLQFIRINGTLVGGAVGVALHLIARVL